MLKFLLAAAALSSSLAVSPVLAQDAVHISYERATLASATGRLALERRVARAVVKVCGDDRHTGSILPSASVRACRAAAAKAVRPQVERAVAQAKRPARVASIGTRN